MSKKSKWIAAFLLALLLIGQGVSRNVFAAGHGCPQNEPDRDGDGVPDREDDFPDDPIRSNDSLEDFIDELRRMGLERGENDPFIEKEVADRWDDLPEDVRNYEPGDLIGNIVDDLGFHFGKQQRLPTLSGDLPGGYHIAERYPGGSVNAHYDAHNPTNSLSEFLRHSLIEVWRINKIFGALKKMITFGR